MFNGLGNILELVKLGSNFFRNKRKIKENQQVYKDASEHYQKEIQLNREIGLYNQALAIKTGQDQARDVLRDTSLLMSSQIADVLGTRGITLAGSAQMIILNTANLGIEQATRAMVNARSEATRAHYAEEIAVAQLEREKEKIDTAEKKTKDDVFENYINLMKGVAGSNFLQETTVGADGKKTTKPSGLSNLINTASQVMDIFKLSK